MLTSNFEQVQNFPEKVEEGLFWTIARGKPTRPGIDPISNYEVVSIGLQDLLTPVAWSELHKPNSRRLSVRMLSSNSVDDTWRGGGESDTWKDFESMQEFRVAMATLDGAFQKVMPWNMAFKTLYTFMVSINFGESDLSSKTNKLVILANFVDEVLRANTRN